ncbi:MAG: glycerophosphodiester phosphodiesterase [Propionibacteriaceae bacterium]|nr:glycerophosphodiester phosphodiesterase [Propionibacteriaceae bacterium]
MNAKDFTYCSPRFAAMAHRGGAKWAVNRGRENTLAAFRNAVDAGYQYVETDVQATKDGVLVCMHDDTLDRVTGEPGRVMDYTAAELRGLRVDGDEPIPFFDDVVEALPQTRFNVDLKTPDAVEPLVASIAAHGLFHRILVDSFSQTRLSKFRSLTYGTIPTALAPPGVVWTRFVPVLSSIVSSPGVAVQVPMTQQVGGITLEVVTPSFVEKVHSLGKVVHVWTIDDPAEMDVLIDMGVDGIITDRPDVLKEVLLRRGLWQSA